MASRCAFAHAVSPAWRALVYFRADELLFLQSPFFVLILSESEPLPPLSPHSLGKFLSCSQNTPTQQADLRD